MDRAKLIRDLAEALQVESAGESTVLLQTTWDSLAKVNVMLLLDEHSKAPIDSEALNRCLTVSDLLALIQS